MTTARSEISQATDNRVALHRAGSAATWKHKRGGKGDAAWQKWVSDELKAWVTWWKANPSVVHYGSNATYHGTMKATPDQAMHKIEMRQNDEVSHRDPKAGSVPDVTD